MNDIFNGQKDTLLSIKREINLLQQQVDFLIRNEKPLALLDLDVLMNRTHTLYDQLCSIDLGGTPYVEEPIKEKLLQEEPIADEDTPVAADDDEELPVGINEILSLFESRGKIEEDEIEDGSQETEDRSQETEDGSRETEEENEDAYFIDEAEDDTPDGLGFILNFEPAEEETEEEKTEDRSQETEGEKSMYKSGDVVEMTIPHPEEEPVHVEEETPHTEEVTPHVEEEEIVYEPVVIGDMEDHDDGGFEFEQPETLGERYQQNQEETVGEKYQHNAVGDLQKAIGINDKFLFVNELFAGSMEKYNRSIENLNDLKTLNGALIYLNELRIELQWNSNNEAYKKLLELVHRKYEA